jgi:4-hydroxy-tetrahydrodipicolinate synthase
MTPSENRSTAWLSGYIPDLPTPFDPNGEIDLDAFSVLCERQIKAGVSALVVCETAGEASTLSSAERDILIRTAIDIARGRVRVIAGAGSNSTSQAIELTQHAEAAGADAVLSVVPYYNKPMQDGIYSHFRSIAESTRLPSSFTISLPARSVSWETAHWYGWLNANSSLGCGTDRATFLGPSPWVHCCRLTFDS